MLLQGTFIFLSMLAALVAKSSMSAATSRLKILILLAHVFVLEANERKEQHYFDSILLFKTQLFAACTAVRLHIYKCFCKINKWNMRRVK